MAKKFDVIKEYLSSIDIPETPIKLCPAETIFNPRVFVESHVQIIEANSGNVRYKPYYDRLEMYYEKLKKDAQINSSRQPG